VEGAPAHAEAPPETQEERGRSLRKAATITSSVGAAHALLFLLAFWLLSDVPGAEASNEEIAEYYSDASSRRIALVGLYVMPFAAIAFVWFIVSLRMWIDASARRGRSILLSNIQLVSGILYVALFCASAAASSVMAASVEFAEGTIDPVVARQFPLYGTALSFVFAFRMAAMFVFATSSMGLASGILPRWFAWSGYAVGLFLLLSASFEAWFALVLPLWLLALSVLLLRGARRIDPELRVAVHHRPAPVVVWRGPSGAQGGPERAQHRL
jgi:hypothetical protein